MRRSPERKKGKQRMKLKLLGGVALAAAFAASGALAENGWYGAVDAGLHQPRDITVTSPQGSASAKGEATEAVVLARIGYRFSPYIRLELEGGSRFGSLKGLTV